MNGVWYVYLCLRRMYLRTSLASVYKIEPFANNDIKSIILLHKKSLSISESNSKPIKRFSNKIDGFITYDIVSGGSFIYRPLKSFMIIQLLELMRLYQILFLFIKHYGRRK